VSQRTDRWAYEGPAKHFDKIKKALKSRQDKAPAGSGFNKPGSMNKKKTGYPKTGNR
jgi:hypothetical protein